MSAITPPAPFNPTGEDWEAYMERFYMFMEANDLLSLSEQRKRALFLTHCGPAVFKMAKALAAPADLKTMTWTTLQEILKAHYAPQASSLVRRHEFYRRDQREGETISAFVATLWEIAAACDFLNLEEAMRDRLVLGLRDLTLQSRLLAWPQITFKEALEEASATEASQKSAAAMKKMKNGPPVKEEAAVHYERVESDSEEEDEEDEVHHLRADRKERQQGKREAWCSGCEGNHPRAECRFRDAICQRCEKKGHIARVCRTSQPASRRTRPPRSPTNNRKFQTSGKRQPFGQGQRNDDHRVDRGETHQTIVIGHASAGRANKMAATVLIEGRPCRMEVDSGSSLSMVSWTTIKKLLPHITARDLKRQRLTLIDYQGNRIPVVGIDKFNVAYKTFKATLPLTIVDRDRPSLLGMEWFEPLGLAITGVDHIGNDTWEEDLMREFAEVFNNELDKYKGSPISFNLDPQVAPFRIKPRRVPFVLRPKIDEQLDKLVVQGEPIDHARWETPIVTPIKPDGSVRLCGDYKSTLNKALQQSAYPVPVVQHLLHSLGRGRIFAKLDLAQAYQQLPVDEATAEAQTIVTHRGAFKCKRLQFGVSVAPGLFQSLMERLLQGIEGVVPYFDDVLISARDTTQLKQRLREVLTRFQKVGLKVKRDKCQLAETQVEFLGYLIDESGIRPTPGKLRAIKEAPPPKKIKPNCRHFWGSFEDIKNLLTSDRVLVQYSGTLPIRLTCDASPFGIGAVLSHKMPNGTEAPIAFFSRTLSKPERNYSQLDKEALAAVAGIKRFHEYLYGRSFELITDHKPLLGIIAGDKPTPPVLSPRMLRWVEFLAAYNYTLLHHPGKSIDHADALSRCPLPETGEDPAPAMTTLLIETMEEARISAADITRATSKDKILARILNWIWKGWPEEKDISTEFLPYKRRQNELSGLRGCVLWGDRVIVPNTLRQQTLRLLHDGHPGIVRMKALARSYVWWPGMDKEIEMWVSSCANCQESRAAPNSAPVHDWENPGTPWARLHIDFAGPCKGNTFLVIVDAYSKWLEVVLMSMTTADAVIKVLRRLFATHGIPDLIISDNGPPFTSNTFEMFLADQGIRHALSAPKKPSTNGLAERMVRSTKETLMRLGPGDIQAKLDKLLAIQHITPSATTHRSPAELLMGRKLRSPLDRLHPQYSTEKPTDSTSRIREFQPGDRVYAKNLSGNPLWVPATITQVMGPLSYQVQTTDGQHWKRHIDQLRGRVTRVERETQHNNQGEGKDTQAVPERANTQTPVLDMPNTSPEEDNSEHVPESTEEATGAERSRRGQPSKVGEGGESTPETEFERVPEPTQREQRTSTSQPEGTGMTELRRSGRTSKRPAYLRDYIA
ncbi:uncharacterized protein K02A2.6-like [Pantherophis guttatus]|uniref:Gypsy retrotransposon integrase-like protein 1 n=1 Tax=Pantherophis guttatus TaxID=94885 RepID=A0ABM3YSE6_PANGU|nr:uncharacterized protein K02A2.6-like [Pantherophis guttatus]